MLNKTIENLIAKGWTLSKLKSDDKIRIINSKTINNFITLIRIKPNNYKNIINIYFKYKYSDNFKRKTNILNKTIFTNKLTHIKDNIYFKIKLNKKKKIVSLIIYKDKIIVNNIYLWNFKTINKRIRKYKSFYYIQLEKIYYKEHYYKYITYDNFEISDFNIFLLYLEKGLIGINFNIDSNNGSIHDHGTCFYLYKKNSS